MKVLETHYEVKNGSSQVRLIEVDFERYAQDIIQYAIRREQSPIMNEGQASEGPTLREGERILAVLNYNETKVLAFLKQQESPPVSTIVSLVNVGRL